MIIIYQIYLDNAATSPLSPKVKEYVISILDNFYNPSSTYQHGQEVRKIITDARQSVAKFINTDSNEIYFTPSGSGSNTLAIKGLTSENPILNKYKVFYSPTAHKSMLLACESCIQNTLLKVNSVGEIDLSYLNNILTQHNNYHNGMKPLVCIEAANSEIGTINDVIAIGNIVHKHNGILVIDATGYIPLYEVNMKLWRNYVDILTFSGHKLHALKGVGILWKKNGVNLKPLIYGSQEKNLIGGTENTLGIASLGKAVQEYDYSSISSANRDYVYNYIVKNIPDSYLVGSSIESGNRLPHNLFMAFKGIEGESLMILLDMNGIQVSTGSSCTSGDLSPSTTLSAIGMDEHDIHSCIRMSFRENLENEELLYVCHIIKACVQQLRNLI
ncbi:cysteine desulfurase [Acetatifactor muris]|uniref:Cysteine desulfurase n=1 Tax=Acetatifactor muris TaxID=879566 RepID=A0A2K4ZPB3_9FIRM|nr:cysteine desulfurase family protein [Acetatifactor muris]MCR2050665.1 cysteine desulfurase [Acetatifactor muris]SOY32212.1 Cysteine desulfurase [Acetatifactor muris]